MAISIRCSCGSEAKLSSKKCPRCTKPFAKKGRKYKVTIRANGRKVTRTVTNLGLAREVESKLKVDAARGEHQLRKKVAPTLSEVWEKYQPWAEAHKPKSFATDKGYYKKHLEQRFGNKRLDSICPFDVERLMLAMKKGKSKRGTPYSPTTIRHVVVLLSRLYSIAETWGMHNHHNPCRKVKKPELNNQVTEFLTDEELNRLMATLSAWGNWASASFVLFLLYTGLRRGELFKIKWSDIDIHRKTITLRDPKGKKDTTLPLSDKAVDILLNIPKEYDTPFVFYGKNGQQRVDFSGPWKRIRKAARLPVSFRLHGLRHHFASALVTAGADLFTVSKLLTHKDVKTTQRYAHLGDQALRDAVALSDKLHNQKHNIVNINQVRKNG
jgi:integrase